MKELNVPIYREKIYIVTSIKECKKLDKKINMYYPEVRDIFKANSQQGKVITFSGFGKYCQILYLFPCGMNRSNIVHESLHICMNILKRRNIKTSNKNSEVLTYLQEYLYKQICQKVKIKP